MKSKTKKHTFYGLIFLVLLALSLAYGLYRGGVESLIRRHDSRMARDPKSRICQAAKARYLGDKDSRKAVLFVHGFLASPNAFSDMPDILAQRGFYVHALRLPGHGSTPFDLVAQSPASLLEAVGKELRMLRKHHECVILVGHSLGGALSTLAASQEAVDGLVLAAPYFGVTYHWYYGLRPETWVRLLAPIFPWFYKPEALVQVIRPEAKSKIFSYPWMPSQAMLTVLKVGELASQPAVLKKITCPVLWMHSQHDRAASFTAAQYAVAAMPAKEKSVAWLPHSNHHVFWDYDREQVDRALVAFVESIE